MTGSLRRRLLAWIAPRPAARAWALLGPGTVWLVLFFLLPMAVMLAYSVMPRGIYGGVRPGFTLEHYRRFLDPLYLTILRRTVVVSLACTVLCEERRERDRPNLPAARLR